MMDIFKGLCLVNDESNANGNEMIAHQILEVGMVILAVSVGLSVGLEVWLSVSVLAVTWGLSVLAVGVAVSVGLEVSLGSLVFAIVIFYFMLLVIIIT